MNAFFSMLMGFLNSAMGQASMLAVVAEFIMRLVPSEKPLGWAHFASGLAKQLAAAFGAIAALLDKILPQNLKALESKPE